MELTTERVRSARRVPGPRRWPLLGNIGVVRGILPFMEDAWKRHGDVFGFSLAGFEVVAIAHPELVQNVLLTKRQNFIKGSAYDSMRRVVGGGSITLEGDSWKERRALAQPAFHRAALEKLTAIMVQSGASYFDALRARVPREGRKIDVHGEMVKLTLDVVVRALFGEGTIDHADVSYEALGNALELVSSGANGVQLPAWIPTPHNLKYQRTMAALDANVYQIIEAGKRAGSGSGSLLSMLLDARDERGAALTDKELRDEIITLFIAGHETTALTLTWLFALLDGQAEVVARMREEVDRVLAGRDPTFQDVAKLAYLRQVVDETLRLRPPVAMVARNVVADTDLGGYAVPGGRVVLPFIWAVHRHRDFWESPEQYNPDRFAPAASKGRSAWSYLPFSAGPRICIGNMFSLIETVLLLAQLLNRFDFVVGSTAAVKPQALGTLRPSSPVHITLRPR